MPLRWRQWHDSTSFKSRVYIHARVQQPQDGDSILSLYVKRDMSSDSEGAHAWRNRVALAPHVWSEAQFLKRYFELITIMTSLLDAPCFLCVTTDLPQVLRGTSSES
jgi:hypothetical protein